MCRLKVALGSDCYPDATDAWQVYNILTTSCWFQTNLVILSLQCDLFVMCAESTKAPLRCLAVYNAPIERPSRPMRCGKLHSVTYPIATWCPGDGQGTPECSQRTQQAGQGQTAVAAPCANLHDPRHSINAKSLLSASLCRLPHYGRAIMVLTVTFTGGHV